MEKNNLQRKPVSWNHIFCITVHPEYSIQSVLYFLSFVRRHKPVPPKVPGCKHSKNKTAFQCDNLTFKDVERFHKTLYKKKKNKQNELLYQHELFFKRLFIIRFISLENLKNDVQVNKNSFQIKYSFAECLSDI